MAATACDIPNLPSSRVYRLLRPLRLKLTSLAAFPSAPSSLVVYSSKPAVTDQSCRPPLSIIQPPQYILRTEKDLAHTLQLSRRIHVATDAFKNVLQGSFNTPPSSYIGPTVPSLATLCCCIIGQSISCSTSEEEEEDKRNDEMEDDEYRFVTEIYEATPLCHRRFIIVSQALEMALQSCPRNPTLLYNLLQSCLQYKLNHLCSAVLDVLLACACDVVRSSSPPLCHPAHHNFLTDLLTLWGDNGASVRTFTRSVTAALWTANDIRLWNTKAVTRLFSQLHILDSQSSIQMLIKACSYLPSDYISAADLQLFDCRLSRWSRLCFQQIKNDAVPNDISSTVICLLSSHPIDSKRNSIRTTNAIVCLYAYIATMLPHHIHTNDLMHLVLVLREATPTTSTFEDLVSYILDPMLRLATTDVFSRYQEQVEVLSDFLQTNCLTALEASFLACVLRHVENPTENLTVSGREEAWKEWKEELMNLVEDAEKRCFSDPGSSHRDISRPTGYRWEDMVGGWVAMTPAVKRQKLSSGLSAARLRSDRSARKSEVENPFHDASNRIPALKLRGHSPVQPKKRISDARPIKRSRSDFTSILTTAFSNRDEIHRESNSRKGRSGKRENVVPYGPTEARSCSTDRRLYSAISSHGFPRLDSDDDLNLFALAASSSPSWRS